MPNAQGPLSNNFLLSCIESANNHVQEVTKQTTVEGAKGREARDWDSNHVIFFL
jgi:hypothetical protein